MRQESFELCFLSLIINLSSVNPQRSGTDSPRPPVAVVAVVVIVVVSVAAAL